MKLSTTVNSHTYLLSISCVIYPLEYNLLQ